MRYVVVKNGVPDEKSGTPKHIRNVINSSPVGTIVLLVDNVITIIEGGEISICRDIISLS